jgi:hypothetical protein
MPPGMNNISFDANNALSAGTYPITNLSVQNYNSWQVVLMNPSTVTFTNYPNNVGEFYEGTVTASFSAGTPAVVHNLSANFRIRRTF